MSEKKERFGRYLILDHLVDGGMAKICRARFLGEQADKVVAIKMVQPRFSQDEAFKNMFIGEIKVTFGLHHPNIVQTYDYGVHNGQLFVAMEYCDGRNLKEYLVRLKQKNFSFPIEIPVYIISQACQGLHYAHTYTDKLTGKFANIIHRDISPHNIMLTYDGAIKVIDFGIAKTDTNDNKTQVGTIKGKLSYLAPEYLEGKELDHRYDQFAVGITLWEMLCSRKLFTAPNDIAVLKKIQECKIPPPSSINPKVPKELDEIILKSLEPNRDDRFENMDKMNRSLIKFLYSNYPDFNATDLSHFAKELFQDEIKKDREKLFEYGKINITPYLEELKEEKKSGEHGRKGSPKEIDFGLDEEKSSSLNLDSSMIISKNRQEEIDQNLKQKDAGTSSFNRKDFSKKESSSPKHTRNKTYPSKYVPKKNLKNLKISIAAGISFFALSITMGPRIFCMAGLGSCKAFEKKKVSERPNEEIILDQLDENRNKTYLAFKNFDDRSMVAYINGVKRKTDILGRIEISSKGTQILRVESIGHQHFIKKITPQDEETILVDVPRMPKKNFSYLFTSKNCQASGKIFFELYGEQRKETIPIKHPLGIPFPTYGDGRVPASEDGKSIYSLYFLESHKTFKRKIPLYFQKAGERKNFCDLISK